MLALLVPLLVWASTGSAVAEVPGLSAPLLAWSNRELFASGGGLFESGRTEHLAGQLVLSALGKLAPNAGSLSVQQSSTEKADLVVIYLGSQVDASALRQGARLQPVQQLSSMMETAQSSLVLPFLKYQGASLLEAVRLQLQANNVAFQAVNCFYESADVPAAVRQAVSTDASLEVLLVCPPTAAASVHSPEALQAEISMLESVQAAVQASDKHVVFVYASQSAAPRSTRRSLQSNDTDAGYSGFGPYTSCGPLCKTQVAWLQGMLSLLFMTIALCAGMTCLHLLNGPSRFETAKETQ